MKDYTHTYSDKTVRENMDKNWMKNKGNAKSKAIHAKMGVKGKGHPINSFSGKRHRFIDSKTKKEYVGGLYGGMSLEQAMDFEKRRKSK